MALNLVRVKSEVARVLTEPLNTLRDRSGELSGFLSSSSLKDLVLSLAGLLEGVKVGLERVDHLSHFALA
jgi:hypothetical protein